MTIGYDKPLYVLPFDHRATLTRGPAAGNGRPSGGPLTMDSSEVLLAPSILAADFARLGQQVAEAEQAGANRIHVNVMDGHFVPNLWMRATIVQSFGV